MDKIINAELPHPEINGPPLERGIRYAHHFVVDVISDGRRLYAVASEEGRKILHEIAHGIGIEDTSTDTAPVALGEASGSATGGDTELPPQDDGLDPEGKPATGGTPQPIGNVTTEVSQANTFDS